MRARSLVATLFSFGFLGALFACSGNPGSSSHGACTARGDCASAGMVWDESTCSCVVPPEYDGCARGGVCAAGTHWDAASCDCVTDHCADPGICGQGMHWDFSACSCQPNGSNVDSGPRVDSGPGACFIPGYGECPQGTSCVIGKCADSQPIVCECFPSGGVGCSSCVGPIDGGPPDPYDGGPPDPYDGPYPYDAPPPPPYDSGPLQGCYLPGHGYCPPLTTCTIGYCPDGVTPISCFCQGDGNSYCTGGCPPPPPYPDAGSD
jgi:hypothetical protein